MIELLMVVAIIGILSSLIIVSLQGAGAKARDTKAKSNAANVDKALAQYEIDNLQKYPLFASQTATTNLSAALVPNYIKTTSALTPIGHAAQYISTYDQFSYAQAWELESTSEVAVTTGNGIYETDSANAAGVVASPAKGSAISFNGVSTSVTIPNNAAYQTAAFSISLWAKPATVGAGTRVLVHKNTAGAGWRVWINAATVTADYQGGVGTATNAAVLSAGTWYHIVATYASGSVIIYVNGVGGAPAVPGFNNTTNVNAVVMGTGAGLSAFSGSIDGLRLYNRVLTPTEVGYLYNSGNGSYGSVGEIAANTLAGGWRLDEGTGNVVASYSTTVNNGALANHTWTTGNSPLGLTAIGSSLTGRAFVTYRPQ
jgi:type II secretory pathway pseudopilin PulG